MENPQTWGRLERAIDQALGEAEQARRDGVIGLSRVRRIADAVRALQQEDGCECLAGNCACHQDEPPFDENHHRYHTPRGPNPKCANCEYVGFHQPAENTIPVHHSAIRGHCEACDQTYTEQDKKGECLGNGSCTC
jgi:hypothetical protein